MNLILLVIGCLIATYFDVEKRIIPNKLLLIMFIFGLVVAIIQGRMFEYLLCSVLGLFILLIPFAMNQMGAGDVKLVAVISGYLGLEIFSIVIYFSIFGALIALGMLVIKKYLPWILDNGIPYALPITLGVITFGIWGNVL